MEFEDQDISEFIAGCAKQFCPWCGSPVIPNRMGRKKKFCSDKCRWAFWKFETRHRDVKTEMEARLNENRRAVHVLYNCSASRPSIASETKEDTIEPVTETLSLTADPRADGLVKARTGDTTTEETYNNWYQSVYVPAEAAEG